MFGGAGALALGKFEPVLHTLYLVQRCRETFVGDASILEFVPNKAYQVVLMNLGRSFNFRIVGGLGYDIPLPNNLPCAQC